MTNSVWALSGFMGLPSDWDQFGFRDLKGVNVDQFEWNTLTDWSKKFNQWIYLQTEEKSILMGYSLGGRLALHALIQNPSIWKAAIIISAHPGLSGNDERKGRHQSDKEWADRFENESWNDLMSDWNARTAFVNGKFNFLRNESDYCRKDLAKTLRNASLGCQSNLKDPLGHLEMPILWVVGESDESYKSLASSITLKHPLSQKIVIAGSAHRVPWEQPELFEHYVKKFIDRLPENP